MEALTLLELVALFPDCPHPENARYLADCAIRQIRAGNVPAGLPDNFQIVAGIGIYTKENGLVSFTGSTPPKQYSKMTVEGPGLWRELHTFCAKWDLDKKTGTPQSLSDFLKAFNLKIECGVCKIHWLEILKTHPPIDEDATLFEWSVAIHNAVNKSIHKPFFSLERAKEIYD